MNSPSSFIFRVESRMGLIISQDKYKQIVQYWAKSMKSYANADSPPPAPEITIH